MCCLCVQETISKWQNPSEFGNGCKLYYVEKGGLQEGVRILLSLETKRSVLEVNREWERVMWIELNVDKVAVNVVNSYAPQAGCDNQEKRGILGTN